MDFCLIIKLSMMINLTFNDKLVNFQRILGLLGTINQY